MLSNRFNANIIEKMAWPFVENVGIKSILGNFVLSEDYA